jgi:hypothetical protein
MKKCEYEKLFIDNPEFKCDKIDTMLVYSMAEYGKASHY